MNYGNRPHLSSLLFYTHNVARALKPSIDGELAHAIHETLHFALDGEPEDFSLPRNKEHPCDGNGVNGQASTSAVSLDENGDEAEQIRPGFFPTEEEDRPYISYAWEKENGTLILPHPSTVTNPTLTDPCTTIEHGSSVRSAFDVTAKFFFLKEGVEKRYPEEWISEAMRRLETATGLDSVDTLILSLGGMNGSKGELDDKMQEVTSLWKRLSPKQQVFSMGLADFSEYALESFVKTLDLGVHDTEASTTSQASDLKAPKSSITSHVQESLANNDNGLIDQASPTHVHIPSSPSKAVFTELATEGESTWNEYGPSHCRRPRLCTINLKEQSGKQPDPSITPALSNGNGAGSCCWDKGLASCCKQNNILLVAHSDRKDILPMRTLPTLMNEFEGKLPYSLPPGKRLEAMWCFKYTVLIRDRGVLADKGFLLYAQVIDA